MNLINPQYFRYTFTKSMIMETGKPSGFTLPTRASQLLAQNDIERLVKRPLLHFGVASVSLGYLKVSRR